MIMPASETTQPKPSRRSRPINTAEMLSPTVLYSAEAEKAVLGCMMAQPAEVINEATIALLKVDFFVPAHQEIFDALRGMYNSSQAIDVMTVHQYLTDRKLAGRGWQSGHSRRAARRLRDAPQRRFLHQNREGKEPAALPAKRVLRDRAGYRRKTRLGRRGAR